MELLTSEENRNWTALLAAVVAAFLLATAVGFVLERQRDPDRDLIARRRGVNPRVTPDEPQIAQAPWKMIAFPAPGPGASTAKQKKAVKRAGRGAKNAVRDLYDSLTISRTRFDDVARRLMPRTARDRLRGRSLVPFELRRIKTIERRARIAIDRRSRSSAAAHINLTFRAHRGERRFTFVHDGTLWLQRGKKRWRVIGFALDQRRRA